MPMAAVIVRRGLMSAPALMHHVPCGLLQCNLTVTTPRGQEGFLDLFIHSPNDRTVRIIRAVTDRGIEEETNIHFCIFLPTMQPTMPWNPWLTTPLPGPIQYVIRLRPDDPETATPVAVYVIRIL
jgi:hypothetical protein